MAIWPLYHFDAAVSCFLCGKSLAPARDGEVVGFGDGNGNRSLRCSCGYCTFFDTTKTEKKAQDHMEANSPYFSAVLAFGGEDRKVEKRGQTASGIQTGSAFDLPAITSFVPTNAFDLGSLITHEVRRQR